ncbi:MAG: exosortase/archaeosortase family protein [Roseibacillus sp.]
MSRKVILPILAYALALWPQILWFVRRTTDPTNEPIGLLALITIGILAWPQLQSFRPHQLLGLSLLTLTIIASFFLPPLLTATLSLLTIAVASGLIRNPGLTGLLILSLPVMASLNFYFAWPVRLGIATCAEILLTLSGLPVTREGTLLLFQSAEVGVDPPCSGIRMLWFTGYLTCALAALHHLPWKKFLPLIPCAILLSFLANILRATLLFFPEAGLLTLPYWTHEALGLALHLFVALILLTFIKQTKRKTKTKCSHPHLSSSSAPA